MTPVLFCFFLHRNAFKFSQYLNIFYDIWPCDWLLELFTRGHVCNIENFNLKCVQKSYSLAIDIKPYLFQHQGRFSSNPGVLRPVEKIVDK